MDSVDKISAELRVRRDEYEAARKNLDKNKGRRAGNIWCERRVFSSIVLEVVTNGKESEASQKEVESLRTQLEEGLSKVCELSEKLKETKQEHVRLYLKSGLLILLEKRHTSCRWEDQAT